METMVDQLGSVTFASSDHPSKSHPWEWVILPLTMPYWYTPHYFGAINYNIWALILPSMVVMGWMAWKNIRRNIALFSLSWFAGTYLVLIPLGLISDRVMYIYYFYPTVGAVCIPVALALSYVWDLRENSHGISRKIAPWVIVCYLFLHLLIFAVLNPLTTP
jgi:dolichyl-phosphate-mannose--protein O-mannosyl transferase